LGGARSPSTSTHKLSADKELEWDRRASGAARIRGSYRYLHHGLKSPHAFERRESRF
jgi:hypothetical protein